MPQILLNTRIYALLNESFNLARSIDLHQESMKHTGEQAVASTKERLTHLGELVPLKARHFGIMMKLTSKITKFQSPDMFVDEMVNGPFHSMKHFHIFQVSDGRTLMVDEFEYTFPLGLLGKSQNQFSSKATLECF